MSQLKKNEMHIKCS